MKPSKRTVKWTLIIVAVPIRRFVGVERHLTKLPQLVRPINGRPEFAALPAQNRSVFR